MSGLGWVGPAVLVIFVLAAGLSALRVFTLNSGLGKGVGAAYLVLAGSLVAVAATAGVMYWKGQVAQAMAPEK